MGVFNVTCLETRSDYKCTMRNSKYRYDKQRTLKLEKARFQNAKEYWKMLKGLTGNSTVNSLSADMLADYFKAINDPMTQMMYFSNQMNNYI